MDKSKELDTAKEKVSDPEDGLEENIIKTRREKSLQNTDGKRRRQVWLESLMRACFLGSYKERGQRMSDSPRRL